MSSPGIREGDTAQPRRGQAFPIVLVLDRLRSAHNVGNIFRLAEVARVEQVLTCGYTASPPHPKLAKTARGCDQLVPSRHLDDALTAVTELQTAGYRVVAVETVTTAATIWEATFAFPVAFVFGNEALGIDADALAACDEVVQLPCFGCKNSLNVGNCAAVVVYRALACLAADGVLDGGQP